MSESKRIPIIVCVGEHGRAVVYGYVDSEPEIGGSCVVYDARMVLHLSAKCGGLFGMAAKGPRGDTRLTHPVSRTGAAPVQQYLLVDEAAARALDDWRPYE